MNRIIAVLYWFLPLFVEGQDNKGIKFTGARNWNEVIDEAIKANKTIFVDAYATWCGPCKQMDRDIYTNGEVGAYVNANFIAVKVQMDSTGDDSDLVKGWRNDAASLKKYVEAYPTYLFFTPEGRYSGKEMGFHKAGDFIALLQKANHPKGSYIAQLKAFEEGRLTKVQLRELALLAKANKDDITATKIARAYKVQYVDTASLDSLLNSEADNFRWNFIDLFTFKDKIIQYMYKWPALADQKLGRYPGYSTGTIAYIINRDYINPATTKADVSESWQPNWPAIERRITKDFDKGTAKRVILNSKISWSYKKKDWAQVAKLEFEKLDKSGLDTTGMGRLNFNNFIYNVVFPHIQDSSVLERAISYMKQIVEMDGYGSSSRLDTYASILYKAGHKKQAIAVENKALKLAIKDKDERGVKFFKEVIAKMEDNQPIW